MQALLYYGWVGLNVVNNLLYLAKGNKSIFAFDYENSSLEEIIKVKDRKALWVDEEQNQIYIASNKLQSILLFDEANYELVKIFKLSWIGCQEHFVYPLFLWRVRVRLQVPSKVLERREQVLMLLTKGMLQREITRLTGLKFLYDVSIESTLNNKQSSWTKPRKLQPQIKLSKFSKQKSKEMCGD